MKAVEDGSPAIQLHRLFKILAQDCIDALREAVEKNSDFHSRSFARNLFALVEGTVYLWKQVILQQSTLFEIALEEGEEAILSEKTASLKSDGSLRIESSKISTLANIKYTLKKANEFFGASPGADFSHHGWERLQEAIRVRDRMMHPKSTEGLTVSEDDLQCCREGLEWFLNTSSNLFDAAHKRSEERNRSFMIPIVPLDNN